MIYWLNSRVKLKIFRYWCRFLYKITWCLFIFICVNKISIIEIKKKFRDTGTGAGAEWNRCICGSLHTRIRDKWIFYFFRCLISNWVFSLELTVFVSSDTINKSPKWMHLRSKRILDINFRLRAHGAQHTIYHYESVDKFEETFHLEPWLRLYVISFVTV